MIDVVPFDEIYSAPAFELVKEFYDEHLRAFGLDLAYLDIESFLETHAESTFLMLEDGQVIGILGGVVTKQPMSDLRVYQETIWYVSKDKRSHGVKLLDHAEEWCRMQGIGQIVMAFIHNSESDRMMSFFGRRGYRTLETHMIRDLLVGENHG